MIPTLSEIILIIVIVVVVFGFGKLTDIANLVGELRSRYKKGLEGEEPIDITPTQEGEPGEDQGRPADEADQPSPSQSD